MAKVTPHRVEAACRKIFANWSKRGVVAAYLYGSLIEGRMRQDSDVDIAVLDSASARIPWDRQGALLAELEGAIGRNIDLQMIRDLLPSHQCEIFRRGLALWIGSGREKEEYVRAAQAAYDAQREEARRHWMDTLQEMAGGLRRID